MGNFPTIYGRFNCVTSRIKVLGELEKKEEEEQEEQEEEEEEQEQEERKKEEEQFWILTVSGRPP